MTPNRSAGRIDDDLWAGFLRWCKAEGLSHTDGMRRMIRRTLGMPEPVTFEDTGSSADQVSTGPA
jgi:hypothetical protein